MTPSAHQFQLYVIALLSLLYAGSESVRSLQDQRPNVISLTNFSENNLCLDRVNTGILLTPVRLDRIRRSIEADSFAYDFLIEKIGPYTRGESAYSRGDLLPGLALRIAIDGAETPTEWQEFFKSSFLEIVQSFGYKNRNSFRSFGADIAYSFLWTAVHYPEFWNSQECALIVNSLETYIEYWLNYYNDPMHSGKFTQDSDETAMLLENLELYQHFVSGEMADSIVDARDRLRTQVETDYIKENGEMAGGFWAESPSYNANTPRFYLRWREIFQEQGGVPHDPDWAHNFSNYVLFSWMADLSGTWLFNDPLGLSINAGGPLVYPAHNFRSSRFTANALLGSAGTDQHRALLWILNNLYKPGKDNLYTGYMRLLSEDNTIAQSANPEVLDLPNGFFSGDQGVFMARSDWSHNANQFFSQNFTPGMVDHVGNMALNYEIYHRSTPITKYAAGASPTSHVNPANTLYIENLDSAHGLYPGVQAPTLRAKGKGQNLGHFANDKFAAVIWEANDIYNVYGWKQNANYATQVTRSIINFWDGLTFVYDHVITDPYETEDLDKRYGQPVPTPYARSVMKLTRFQGVPTYTEGAFKATALGKDHYYLPILGGETTTIVNENQDQPWASFDKNTIYPSHRAAHIQETITATDVEFAAAHTWGDLGAVQPPDAHQLTVETGNVKAFLVNHNNQSRIVLFNKAPQIPIRNTIIFRIDPSLLQDSRHIYALGWDNNQSFQLDINHNLLFTISISPGGDLWTTHRILHTKSPPLSLE